MAVMKVLRGRLRGKSMYLFSQDLFWGCQYYALIARDEERPYERLLANTSCVMFASSYLEAQLNELIAQHASLPAKGTKPNARFWQALDSSQRDLSLKQKWDLITCVRRGKRWDSGREPFQSYDLILTLRNELVHFKGRWLKREEIPVAKVKALLQRFGVSRAASAKALRVNTWVRDLLAMQALGTWVASVVDDFDRNLKVYITGQKLNTTDKAAADMKRMFQVPFGKIKT